jgi:hypothetical protein
MKNLHLLPTDKPSRLTIRLKTNELMYSYKEFVNQNYGDVLLNQNQNIYITSDEEIKEGDWFYSIRELIEKAVIDYDKGEHFGKIILTTDQDLIADGVQAIDVKFFEWFVKNPTCEKVEVYEVYSRLFAEPITPQEEPKIPTSIKELITEISIKELLMEIREWEKQWELNPNSSFLKNMDEFADELGKKYTVTKKQ